MSICPFVHLSICPLYSFRTSIIVDSSYSCPQVSLLPVFKKGFADQWIPIGTRDKWGKKVAAGELHIEFDFVAPPGVAFPQRRPDIDCFDDSERVDRERKALTDKENDQKAQADFTDAIGGDRPHTAAETLASKEEMARMEKVS